MSIRVFVELWCGSGRLGREVGRVGGHVLLWDIKLGPAYDIRSDGNRRLLLGWAKADRLSGMHMAVPCETFSRGRDRPNGPRPLRDNASPLGKDGLVAADRAKVLDANAFVALAMRLARVLKSLNTPWSVENPRASRLWLVPSIERMRRSPKVETFFTEYCMWGERWRKATAFMCFRLPLDRLSEHRCLGARRGLCARTGQPHWRLEGLDDRNRWRTAAAEGYPVELCRVVARGYASAWASARGDQFERCLRGL